MLNKMSLERGPKVHVISTHTIKNESRSSSKSDQRVRINLTPSDLELLQLEYEQHGFLYPYPRNVATTDSLVQHLQLSLQRTLHFFPPWTGRLSSTLVDGGTATCFFIDCNNAGVDFVHAALDQDVNLPVAGILGSQAVVPEVVFYSFFPLAGVHNYEGVTRPLLAIQVTEMVDWLFIAWSSNHLVSDAKSFWPFFKLWTEISSGRTPIENLSSMSKPRDLNRDRLNLHLVGCRSIKIGNEHLSFDGNMAIQDDQQLDERVFRFTHDSVVNLKARANCEMENSKGKISSLQAITAHIWRSIIRCRLSMDSDIQETTFEIPIDVRRRLNPPIPDEYMGNVISPGIVTLRKKDVIENGLGWTAWQVNEMLVSSTRPDQVKEFFTSWVKQPKFLKFDGKPRDHFVLIHSPKFDVYGNDFGWGKPVVWRSGKSNRFDGRLKVSSGHEKGSMEIEACLSPETLFALEQDAEFMKYVAALKSRY